MSLNARGTRADNTGVSLRRLYRQILSSPYAQGTFTQAHPSTDPGMQSALSLQGFQDGPQIAFGVVTDVTAIANCYRIQLDKMHYPITATLGTQGSVSAFGARPLDTIQPGSPVVVTWHPNLYYAVILAVIPFAQTDGQKTVHEQLCHTSRNRVDEGHKKPMKLGGGGFITDWLSGRPFDATHVGEGGWIAETGMRIFVDPFMAQIGLDEATSVTAFYHDQLLRIAAYNLRMFTAGHEREGMDDGCEYNDWSGYTPYPWEQLGLVSREDPRLEKSPQAWQIDEPWNGPWEMQKATARSWHRLMEYRGYIGQGGKTTVCTKPIAATQALFAPTQPIYPALYDEMTTLDGRHLMASAKGIHIVKRSGLISPQRKYVPEQIGDEGDSDANYKFAGAEGDGPEHSIQSCPTLQGDPQELVRAASVQDLHAYLFNYVSFHGAYWHEKDWDCPEQSGLTHIDGQFLLVPTFQRLASSMYLQAPTPAKVAIDHRYEDVDIYGNEAGISILDDGGVVIYDGFGGEIRMTGGSVFISAPGDVWLKSGRTTNVWGGDDVIVRAKNSLDLSTTEKDVRIKAETNMQLLSGNSGIGGTLVESRGGRVYGFEKQVGEDVQSGAVMLRSMQSDVTAWANRIYLRTGTTTLGDGSSSSAGPIVLDADKGKQGIITHAGAINHYIDGPLYVHYGTEGELRKSMLFSEHRCDLPARLYVDGPAAFDGNVMCQGSFLASGGHIATTQGCSSPLVGCLKDAGSVNAVINNGRENINTEYPQKQGKPYYDSQLEELLYEAEMAGNEDVIASAEFSFRTVSQYGTSEFKLFEDRWQQQGRLAENVAAKWAERVVTTQTEDTYPYPGAANYIAEGEDGVLMQLDLSLVDLANNRDADRGASPDLNDEYKDPTTEEPEPAKLDEYLVIR